MKPVLVCYASAGNGHRTAAKAVAESIDATGRTPVLADILDFTDPVFRRIYSDVYHAAGEHSHGVCSAMYRLTNTSRDKSPIVRMIDRVNLNRTHPFTRFIIENRPDSVVATHFLPMLAVAELKNKEIFSGSLFAVVTDFDLHQMWFSPYVDGYFVATSEIEGKLIAKGVPKERIVMSGIPVRSLIADGCHDSANSMRTDSFSLLFLASSIADDKAIQIFDLITSLRKNITLSIICGRNESLYNTLREKTARGTSKVEIFGFVNDIQRHYARSDLLITKPGGLTVAESLCFGLPMLLVYPIPFQETRNAEFVQRNGAGWLVSGLSSLGRMTDLLFRERQLLRKAKQSCLALSRPEASKIIAHEVIRRSISSTLLRKEISPAALAAGSR